MEGKSTIYNLFYNNLLQSSVIFFKNSNFPKKKISKSPDFQKHPRVPPLVFSKSPIGEHFGGQQSKWRIWRTKWPNGEHPPEWRTLDTYDSDHYFCRCHANIVTTFYIFFLEKMKKPESA